MRDLAEMLIRKHWARSAFWGSRRKQSLRRFFLISLAFPLAWVALIRASVGQEAPHREFSAIVLVRETGTTAGYGARVYVKQDALYLDLPDLAQGRRIPFWFLSDGTLATVKEALVHEPSLEMPLVFMLHFRPTHPDRFCEEFRAYYVAFEKLRDDLSGEELQKLQHPQKLSLRIGGL
jgi:hypothetical protein